MKSNNTFRFDIAARDGELARAGTITTPHGTINTPAFTVVGTYGQVRFLPPAVLRAIGAQAMLCNGYHLFRAADRLYEAGGIATASGWGGPTVTDSGGFQVMSLGSGIGKVVTMDACGAARAGAAKPESERLAKVTEEGVSFQNPVDGRLDMFTPEVSMGAQFKIGADITMAFDELTSFGDSYSYNVEALDRTERWAARSLSAMREAQAAEPAKQYQAVYGILQGAHYQDLREAAARSLGAQGFDGYGLGGAFEKRQLGDILRWTNSILPEGKPRHLLGLSRPDDIFVGVANGADTFDCVAPTREARHGRLYTPGGHINVLRSEFGGNPAPIDPHCDCPTCHAPPERFGALGSFGAAISTEAPSSSSFVSNPELSAAPGHNGNTRTDGASAGFISTGVLRLLLKSHNQGERRLGYTFASAHNVRFITRLMEQIRASLIEGTFADLKADHQARQLGSKGP